METGKRESMRMEIESRSENEEFARVVVAVFASRLNPTLEEIDDIKTAVSEAVTNAVIHGYGNGDGVIYIETAAEGQELCVTIRDTAAASRTCAGPWSPCIPPTKAGSAPAWGFPSWRRSWTPWRWSRSRAGAPRCG